MKKTALVLICTLPMVWISACDSGDELTTGSLRFSFRNVINDEVMELRDLSYLNANGDTFSIEEFNYYISNVTLGKSGSSAEFLIPESYFLIRKQDGVDSHEISVEDVPSGMYDVLRFSIGIDPEKNTSLDSDGDLNPSNNMAWNWNTGYKFVLLEGRYKTVSGQEGVLVFHIGRDENYHTMEVDLTESISIQEGKVSEVLLETDAAEMFVSPYTIDFSVESNAQFGTDADSIAVNYRDMITLKSVSNGLGQ